MFLRLRNRLGFSVLQNPLFWIVKPIVLAGETYCFSVRNNRSWKPRLTYAKVSNNILTHKQMFT